MIGSQDMGEHDTPRPSSSAPQAVQHPRPTVPVPSTSRMRNPPPPSPLSRIQSDGPMSHDPSLSTSRLNPPRPLPFTAESSPCFIHSQLDRHGSGSLSGWLHNQSQPRATPSAPHRPTFRNDPTPIRTGSQPSHAAQSHSTQHPFIPPSHRAQPAPSSSRMSSPHYRDSSGYDSDKSSNNGLTGSAILDGDLVEDDEAGSLTRQLAETAQGVRQMSKELGRTRVHSRIQHILIVTKARDNRLIQLTRELALYLMERKPASSPDGANRAIDRSRDRGMVVYVDAQLRKSKRFDAAGILRDYPHLFEPVMKRRSSSVASFSSAFPSSTSVNESRQRDEGQLRYWTGEMCSISSHLFDFVITLGGDGTVLFTSWLFQKIVPPVLPFALGSLGFLTNFDFANYKQTMDQAIDDGIRVNLRMRFTCTIYRAIAPEEAAMAASQGGKRRTAIKRPGGEILMRQVDKGGWEALEGNSVPIQMDCEGKDREIMCFSTRPVEQFEVLNDLVVDRGPSPYVSLLELFGDEHHLTTVQADGLTISTPTGSTAYSLSAGGSLVHPQIPTILITPICPHTLSFRPMLLPDSMELRICVPYNSRSTAWASFDGRGRVELKQGDHIKVTASKYPFPTVCADKASPDWFSSISRTLRWNEREKQKSFVVVEEESEPSLPKGSKQKNRTQTDTPKGASSQAYALKLPKVVGDDGDGDEVVGNDEDGGDEEDEDDEEGFDIDDKSGGEASPPSPNQIGNRSSTPVPDRVHSILDFHGSGVQSPNRFASPYDAPPPLSQRHLVKALAAAEIQEKQGEAGQRDDIRSDGSAYRVNGHRSIRHGRVNTAHSTVSHDPGSSTPGQNPTDRHTHRGQQQENERQVHRDLKRSGKALKAFAFFGQDDSASDPSDGTSD